MIGDDDSYAIDADGHRVLIGLSAQETEEFIQLDGEIGGGRLLPGIACAEWVREEDRRWLELYEKHETARRPFLKLSRTRH